MGEEAVKVDKETVKVNELSRVSSFGVDAIDRKSSFSDDVSEKELVEEEAARGGDSEASDVEATKPVPNTWKGNPAEPGEPGCSCRCEGGRGRWVAEGEGETS